MRSTTERAEASVPRRAPKSEISIMRPSPAEAQSSQRNLLVLRAEGRRADLDAPRLAVPGEGVERDVHAPASLVAAEARHEAQPRELGERQEHRREAHLRRVEHLTFLGLFVAVEGKERERAIVIFPREDRERGGAAPELELLQLAG